MFSLPSILFLILNSQIEVCQQRAFHISILMLLVDFVKTIHGVLKELNELIHELEMGFPLSD